MSLRADDSGHDQQLDELIDSYFELIESGQEISIEAWVERYPDRRGREPRAAAAAPEPSGV